jgi:hypothetical protein
VEHAAGNSEQYAMVLLGLPEKSRRVLATRPFQSYAKRASILRPAARVRVALQAGSFCGATVTGQFRALVGAAFLAHAVVLFVLPKLPSLFSTDSMELMKYGGHGAHVAMNHPVIFGLYLLPFPAFIAAYFFKNWGRYLLLAFLSIALLGSFFFGVSISGPPETFFGYAASLLDGAILGLAFLSPLKERFAKRGNSDGA